MPVVLSGSNLTVPNHLKLGQFAAFKSDDKQAAFNTGESISSPDSSNFGPESRWELVWALKRNSALAPKQFMKTMALLLLVSLLSAVVMWNLGSTLALPLAVVAVLFMMGSAFVYTRHVADQDFIGLRDDLLRVETHRGPQVMRWDFNPRWVRIEPRDANGSLVRLSGQGKFVDVGRYLRDDLRLQLASELRWAVRQMSH